MRTLTFATLASLGLALGACGEATINRGVESVHQPVVSRADYVFDVNASNDGLSPGEAGRLSGWFESLRLGYGDRVSVDMADAGYSVATRDAIADLAARYGLLLDSTAPVTTGAIAPGNVRVVISRMKASVPGCPDWSGSMSDDLNSNSGSNFGCATNSNLAAMVANPADLVSGQQGSVTSDARTSGKAIGTYRSRKPTGEADLKQESSKQ
jgi:pilus assembly protein CpaD